MRNSQPYSYLKNSGFTLIEVMIVVAIVSILVTLAYPSYQKNVHHANRTEAIGILLEIAQLMERNFTENNSYKKTAAESDFSLPDTHKQSPRTGTQRYKISISDLTDNSYTLKAEPTGMMANDTCGTLTLTHTGVRGADADNCW